jgi:predicted RNA polymerase sigma factor
LNEVGRAAEALLALERAEAADGFDPRIPYARATLLADAGRLEEAREAVRRAVELAPGWDEAQRLIQMLDSRR